jgi:electron transfer flavoprotein alpha subunit
MAAHEGVLVCDEIVNGRITLITKELLSMGRRLVDELNQPLNTLLIGRNAHEVAAEIISLGADKVYIVDGLPFAESHPEVYVTITFEVCKQITPSIVLFGHTEMGRDVAPRLATRLNTSVTVDCIQLSIDPETKRLLQTKPVYGGNAIAIWVADSHDPQVVTIRPRAVMAAEPDMSRKGEISTLDITVDDSAIKEELLETVKEEIEGIKLEDAKIIVSGGGGIGGRDGFEMLEDLAKVLGGTVGVSRVPCDEGWKPLSLEIGQTGHIVTPTLYIAVGISGAPQHMAGCSASKYIIAINRDPDAQIFKEADFGVVGDYRQVLPALIEKCKALLG